jgi:hypothetical protein
MDVLCYGDQINKIAELTAKILTTLEEDHIILNRVLKLVVERYSQMSIIFENRVCSQMSHYK